MTEETYHKSEIAKAQLETAVSIFLIKKEYSSAITLSGAAGAILQRLVILDGKEPFVDFSRIVCDEFTGNTPKREPYNHHIEKSLGITTHKHMRPDDSEVVEIDLEKSAADSLIKALSDYIQLFGDKEPFVNAFFNWAWINLGSNEILEQYKNIPERLKR